MGLRQGERLARLKWLAPTPVNIEDPRSAAGDGEKDDQGL